MQVAGVIAKRFGERVEEGDDVVADSLLQLSDPVDVDGSPGEPGNGSPGNLTDLDPAFGNDELDPQP